MLIHNLHLSRDLSVSGGFDWHDRSVRTTGSFAEGVFHEVAI